MRSKRGIVLVVGLVLWLGALGTSFAGTSDDPVWVWSGEGVYVDVSFSLTDGSMFGFVNSAGQYTTLLDSDYNVATISVSLDEGTYFASYTKEDKIPTYNTDTLELEYSPEQSDSVALGASSNIWFKFSNPDGTWSSSYELIDNGGGAYALTYGSATVQVSTYGNISPSTVPIPASAILLGSSILGLFGLSSRKKKA